jgi:hypothetical protein
MMIRRAAIAAVLTLVGPILAGAAPRQRPAEPSASQTGATSSPQAGALNPKKIVQDMHEANYTLKKHGLGSVHCSVQVNWADMYQELDATGDDSKKLLVLLEKSRFKVAIGPEGSTSISVESDEPPPNEQVAERMRQALSGAQETITGFFNSWAGFMVRSMIPQPDEEYQLKAEDGGYLLTYSEGKAIVSINTDTNLKIGHVDFKSEKLSATFDPTFDPTPDGYVLTGYSSNFTAPAGQPTSVTMTIENETVDGLVLPRALRVTVPYKDKSLPIDFVFSDYKVAKTTN